MREKLRLDYDSLIKTLMLFFALSLVYYYRTKAEMQQKELIQIKSEIDSINIFLDNHKKFIESKIIDIK